MIIPHTRGQTGYTNAFVAQWTLAAGDQGDAFSTASYSDKSVQVFGTFGVGGAVTLQGSNNGINWDTLNDEQGVALTFVTSGIKMPAQATRFVRPSVTGDGTTSLTVIVFYKE